MRFDLLVVTLVASLISLVVVSYLVEMLRRPPRRPDRLSWAPDIPIEYTELGGARVRYIKTGSGPNLVLLHTLRMQLDIFQKVIPGLAEHFTVYAYDYPGHGWSDIPQSDALSPELKKELYDVGARRGHYQAFLSLLIMSGAGLKPARNIRVSGFQRCLSSASWIGRRTPSARETAH
jgi:alpha/beta hydrolase fold